MPRALPPSSRSGSLSLTIGRSSSIWRRRLCASTFGVPSGLIDRPQHRASSRRPATVDGPLACRVVSLVLILRILMFHSLTLFKRRQSDVSSEVPVFFQYILKGIPKIGPEKVEKIFSETGLRCNWWRGVSSITSEQIKAKLNSDNLYLHLE